jgi:hypothetical protein
VNTNLPGWLIVVIALICILVLFVLLGHPIKIG